MTNPFYNHGGAPVTGSGGSSAVMRAEFDAVTAGFDKMPALTPSTIVGVNAGGTALTNYTTTGSGPVVVLAASPTIVGGTISSLESISATTGSFGTLDGSFYSNDAVLSFASGTKLNTGHSGQASALLTNGNSSIFRWGPSVEEFYVPGHTTTASAANAFLDSSSGQLMRSTSSLQFKTQIEDIAQPAKVLDLKGIWYRSTLPADDPNFSFYSFGAEDVAAVDPRFANWGRDVVGEELGENGIMVPVLSDVRPNGINHIAIIANLVEVVKQLSDRVGALESRG